MKPDVPKADQDNDVASYSQEIEYALILQRMIDAATENPEQMRATVYGFARARLKVDTSWASRPERIRLAAALETAIEGVERFSVRRPQPDLLPPPITPSAVESDDVFLQRATAAKILPSENLYAVTPASEDIFVPNVVYPRLNPASASVGTVGITGNAFGLRLCLGVFLIAAVGASVGYGLQMHAEHATSVIPTHAVSSVTFSPATVGAVQPPEQLASINAKRTTDFLGFAAPANYGIYGVSNGVLSELHPLSERVPDKRIAMSTPVNEPSQTVLQDGRTKFVLYRRDLAASAPERVDVRVVAKVERALTFAANGKPSFSPVSDAWNIRNISYEFRVQPVAGDPEMLLVRPEKADFLLQPGRYVLVLKDQGYDFTVAGKVTDRSQCLERTDASNGSFYSECPAL